MKNDYIRVRLDEVTRMQIEYLSDHYNSSMSDVVRLLIHMEFVRYQSSLSSDFPASILPFKK